MTNFFVTRHPGAIEWARRNGIDAVAVSHLDTGAVKEGDIVMGTLPVNLVASINRLGARYLHLSLEVPKDMRGKDLSADEMEAFGAALEEFEVKRIL